MSRHAREPQPDTDGTHDSYDHAINLVDTTESNGLQPSLTRVDSPSWKKLTKEVTRGSVRDSLNRRKYARWQQDRFDGKEGAIPVVEEHEAVDDSTTQTKPPAENNPNNEDEVLDLNQQDESVSAPKPVERMIAQKKRRDDEAVIDILYENQRGAFFCGIPLYSHSSLLNFDPGAWVNKDYRDSAVNITNAQVPDPSWEWDWKHWYVDMSDDVDEDGWQYSFAFFGNFAWHGTHPWFHSYVRRRRWLRRRSKKEHARRGKDMPSSMSQGHKLNTDYFTIHSRTRSPGRPLNATETDPRPESYVSYGNRSELEEGIPEDIKDIATLLKALRMSSIDREKIDVIKKFVESGGEELVYLKDRIPGIMSLLVFQNSRRQVLEYMKQKAKDAQDHRDQHDAEDRPEGDAESRRINNLLKAVEAADEQIRGLEYWSDRKHVLKITEEAKHPHDRPLSTIFDKPVPSPRLDADPAGDIKGISAEADVGLDGTRDYSRRTHQFIKRATHTDEKGKGKGKENTEPETAEEKADEELAQKRLSPQLKQDEMLVPDEKEE